NHAPVVSSFTKGGFEDNALTFAAADFTGHFSDADGDALAAVRIETLPAAAAGTLKLNGTAGAARPQNAAGGPANTGCEPALNFSGTATFQYSASDGALFSAAPATVTLTISSAFDQAADLRAKVLALTVPPAANVPPPLNAGQANALIVKLNLHGNAG